MNLRISPRHQQVPRELFLPLHDHLSPGNASSTPFKNDLHLAYFPTASGLADAEATATATVTTGVSNAVELRSASTYTSSQSVDCSTAGCSVEARFTGLPDTSDSSRIMLAVRKTHHETLKCESKAAKSQLYTARCRLRAIQTKQEITYAECQTLIE